MVLRRCLDDLRTLRDGACAGCRSGFQFARNGGVHACGHSYAPSKNGRRVPDLLDVDSVEALRPGPRVSRLLRRPGRGIGSDHISALGL